MTRASPFAIIAGAFAAGIWLAAQFFVPIWFTALAACAFAAVTIVLRRQRDYGWAAACVFLLACGALRTSLATPPPSSDSLAHYNGHYVVLEGTVIEEPDVRAGYANLRVQVSRMGVDSEIVNPEGLALVRADKSVNWQYGDVIRAFGTLDAPPVLSGFDYRTYLAHKGVLSWMPRPAEPVLRIGGGQGNLLYAALLQAKARMRLSSQLVMPSPESALLNGILIGDDNELPAYIQDAFRRTGTSHIVAISGFNVSIVIAMVMPILTRLFNKRRAAAVALPAILVYTLLTGASPSVVRAAVMAAIMLIGQLLWRRGFTLNTLCATAFFMLLADPQTLFDSGFQLSFAATLGLVLYADRISQPVRQWMEQSIASERVQKWCGVAADALLTTVAANLTTTPLLLADFNQFSWIALLSNALVLPLQPATMVSGIVATLAGMISTQLGTLVALPAYALLTATLRIVQWTGAFPWAASPLYWFGAPQTIGWYALLGAGMAALGLSLATRKKIVAMARKNLRAGTVVLVMAIAITLGTIYYFQRSDGKLHVTLSGAGALIQTPGGRHVVFAGGGSVLPVMGRAMPIWDKAVELLLLPQRNDLARADALPILQRYKVGVIIQPDGEDEPSALLDEWKGLVATQAGQVISMPIGSQAIVEPGVVLTLEQRVDGAIGARLGYGNTTFELAGNTAVISGTLDNADVVFVGVKGGDPTALNAAHPRFAVWADAGGAPRSLDPGIRAIALRDAGLVEFVTDGQRLDLVKPDQ